MCRHAAYVGPPIAIDRLTHGTSHDLTHQSYQARELLVGTVCADGFGVGWYNDAVRLEPARYASPMPIWSDTNLASMGPLIHSGCIVAAVRNATVQGTTDAANCAPFAKGRYLFSLNGFLTDVDSWEQWFVDQGVTPKGTDAESLFAVFLKRLDEMDAVAAAQSLVRDCIAEGNTHHKEVQLSILIADGERVIAVRSSNQPQSNSMYVLRDGDDIPGGVMVASEPLHDDPGWEPIAHDSLVVLQGDAPPVRLRI